MEDEQEDVLSAQDADDETTAPSDDSADAPVDAQAASPDTASALRDRLAQQGRELAASRQRSDQIAQIAAQQQQQITQMQQQIAQTNAYLSTQQKQQADARERQTQAYLATLPPDERALEEIKILKAQIAGAQQRPPMQPPARREPTPAEMQAYQQQKSAEILNTINAQFGTQLDGTEDGIDWTNEHTFTASARLYAKLLASADEDEVPAVAAKKAPETDVSKIVEREVAKALGVSRPNGASGRSTVVPTESDLRKIVAGTGTPRQKQQALRDAREKIDASTRKALG